MAEGLLMNNNSIGLSYEDALKSYTPEQWQAFGAAGGTIGDTGSGFMNWMGTDSAKNTIGLGGLAMSGFGAYNNYQAGQQAKKQWEAENARANEIMAMNREKYATYKADKERLNAGYSGGLAASGGVKNG